MDSVNPRDRAVRRLVEDQPQAAGADRLLEGDPAALLLDGLLQVADAPPFLGGGGARVDVSGPCERLDLHVQGIRVEEQAGDFLLLMPAEQEPRRMNLADGRGGDEALVVLADVDPLAEAARDVRRRV